MNRFYILSFLFLLPQGLLPAAQAVSVPKKLDIFKTSRLEKMLRIIEKSEFSYWFQPVKQIDKYNAPLADEKFQAMGKEAQIALNIPAARQVPIKILPADYSDPKGIPTENLMGVATASAIYINQEAFLKAPYGWQRAFLFHEAVHIKYCDDSGILMLGLISTVGLSGLGSSLIVSENPRLNFSSLTRLKVFTAGSLATVASAVKLLNSNLTDRRQERRADVQAFYALQCSPCLEEFVNDQDANDIKLSELRKNGGYLAFDKVRLIADDFKKQNIKCAYHSKNQIIPSKL